MYEEMVERLRNNADHYMTVEGAAGLVHLLTDAADAIDELDTLLDGVEADNDALCEIIEKLKGDKSMNNLESVVLENLKKAHINICMGCRYTYPECPSESQDALFGDYDNICACAKFKPCVSRWTMPELPKEEDKSGN